MTGISSSHSLVGACHSGCRMRGRRPLLRGGQGAFSLVEVAMALGVLAFGLFALLGVVPVAMDRYRDARDYSVTADVMRSLAGELQWVYEEGQTPNLRSRYFTVEGIETDDIDEGIYEATLTERNPAAVDLFGASLDALKAVEVRMFRLPGGEAGGAEPMAVFTIFVPS